MVSRHHGKERLKINKLAKCEANHLKPTKVIAPQICENLHVCMVVRVEVGWGWGEFVPPPYKRLYNFATLRSYIFVSFQQIIFKPGKLANLKALFPAE